MALDKIARTHRTDETLTTFSNVNHAFMNEMTALTNEMNALIHVNHAFMSEMNAFTREMNTLIGVNHGVIRDVNAFISMNHARTNEVNGLTAAEPTSACSPPRLAGR